MSLQQYNKKRAFNDTPEPEGKANKGKQTQLMFVVQKHQASQLHYDFRLELDGVLKSWAIPKGPSLRPEDKRLAVAVEDHPVTYATFEGIIPTGNYGAGEVIVWDIGIYEGEGERKIREGLKEGKLTIILHGQKLKGEYTLTQMKDDQWLLIKKNDEHAKDVDITIKTKSVLSQRSLPNERKSRTVKEK
jgi:bifunctional non-homologous end joining protein LigD